MCFWAISRLRASASRHRANCNTNISNAKYIWICALSILRITAYPHGKMVGALLMGHYSCHVCTSQQTILKMPSSKVNHININYVWAKWSRVSVYFYDKFGAGCPKKPKCPEKNFLNFRIYPLVTLKWIIAFFWAPILFSLGAVILLSNWNLPSARGRAAQF